jgi:hypothetical protein
MPIFSVVQMFLKQLSKQTTCFVINVDYVVKNATISCRNSINTTCSISLDLASEIVSSKFYIDRETFSKSVDEVQKARKSLE